MTGYECLDTLRATRAAIAGVRRVELTLAVGRYTTSLPITKASARKILAAIEKEYGRKCTPHDVNLNSFAVINEHTNVLHLGGF